MVLSMTHYQDLIDKVRAATGPDRELDALIHVTMNPEFATYPRNDNESNVGWMHPEFGRVYLDSAYTASIDVTVALIEKRLPGCAWSITRPHAARKRKRKPDGVRIPFDAYIANNDDVGVPGHVFALTEGPTAPLAIILALLLALQSNEATNVE